METTNILLLMVVLLLSVIAGELGIIEFILRNKK
jgi:hypothetical protein